VEGVVSRLADFGVFVQIEGLVEGLMHVSETGLARGKSRQDHFKEGDPVRARILRIDDADMKVGLSAVNLAEGGEAGGDRRGISRGRGVRAPESRRPRRLPPPPCEESPAEPAPPQTILPRRKSASARRPKTQRPRARSRNRLLVRGRERFEKRRTMTKAELIERVAVATDVTKKQAETIVDTVFDSIVRSLKEGEKIELRGFGSSACAIGEPAWGATPRPESRWPCPPRRSRTSSRGKN
jgi:nucleoid DNA-binding protein